ncbi:MAG: hypothetical protein IC227_03625 [Enterococcus lacertideformus]|uniref:YcaO domain-containing protein n=1 Tax=Enterococcus lacertideformus TaxID=2771493 RepID=A0A931F8A2_9ENTE|nr:hypothetical protein [Enterococcus lacertideformus]
MFYSSSQNFSAFDFVLEHSYSEKIPEKLSPPNFSTVSEELNYVVSKVIHSFARVISVDLSPEFLLREDLHAIRMVVPGMLPMTFGEQYRRVSITRIKKYLKFKQEKFKGINLNPHPFP